MNEPTLRKRQQTYHLLTVAVSIVALVSSIFSLSQFYFDHDKRITVLEEFRSVGDRFTATDAEYMKQNLQQQINALKEATLESNRISERRLEKIEKSVEQILSILLEK